MKKIILGYEKYDSSTGFGWNFNGRIEPSSKPMTVEALCNANSFVRNMYGALITPEVFTDNAKMLHQSLFHGVSKLNSVDRKQVDDIDEFYFYPIIIGNMQVYLNHTSHIAISDKVREDVTKNKAIIVFLYHFEGHIKYELHQLKALVDQLNVPKENVMLIHGDFNVSKYQDMPFLYEPVNVFPFWVKDRHPSIVSYEPKYTAVCYNRTIRPPRIWFLSKLHRAGLLPNINFSLGSTRANNLSLSMEDYIVAHNKSHFKNSITDEEIQFLLTCENTSTDQLNLIENNPAQMVVLDDYKTSFVSLITETLTDADIMFFSEKIYKPISVGHPFIVLGNPKMLQMLRQFGFKTFSDYWDESYDLEEDLEQRMIKIISIMHELNSKPVVELVAMRESMKNILEHNQKLLNEKYPINSEFGDQTEIKDILLRYTERKQ